jgi:hypothetical protein
MKKWIELYEKKAEKFELLPGFQIYFEPDKGFFCWAVWGDVFQVDHSCTNDFHYFFEVANKMAKEKGCTKLRTQTTRNPAAYLRLTKGKLVGLSFLHQKGLYWVFEKEVS